MKQSVKTSVLIILLAVVVLCAVCAACGLYIFLFPPDERYGKGLNPERERRGLPIIPDNWISTGGMPDDMTWQRSFSEVPERPYYSHKHVTVIDENTFEEVDYYEGARLVTTLVGDHYYDYVKITCTYHLNDTSYLKCTAIFSTGGNFRTISREEGIAILNEWGLKYP